MVTDVMTENRPRNVGCAISAEYTADGELDKPITIPIKQRATNNWIYINSLSTRLDIAIMPHDMTDSIFIVYNVFLRPYLSST